MSDADRTRVWEVPGGHHLRQTMIENGYGDVVALAEAHVEIDTAAMRRTAIEVYGVSEAHDNDVVESSGARSEVARGAAPNAPVPVGLDNIAEQIRFTLGETVQDEWEGDAYHAFHAYITALRNATAEEAERLHRIGNSLLRVADALDRGKKDVTDTILGAAGMLSAGAGFIGVGGLAGLAMAVGGLVLEIANYAKESADTAAERAKAEADGRIALAAPVIEAPSPELEIPDFPDDLDAWQIRAHR